MGRARSLAQTPSYLRRPRVQTTHVEFRQRGRTVEDTSNGRRAQLHKSEHSAANTRQPSTLGCSGRRRRGDEWPCAAMHGHERPSAAISNRPART